MLAGYSRPAISLSGGLDSQAVAAYAARALPSGQRLLAITAVPQPDWDGRESRQGFGDERQHAEALVAMYPQVDFEAVDAAGLSFDHHLEAMFLLSGTPPRNAMNMAYIHAIHARAATGKCDVLLTGTFGNATFSFNGAGALPSLLRRGRWGTLLRELSAGKRAQSLGPMVAKQIVAPFLPEPLYRGLMRWRHGARADPLQSWSALDSIYARDMRVRERAVSMGLDAVVRPSASTRAARIAIFGNAVNEASTTLQALETLHGIPTRDPTAYRPLVEFCLGIPDDQYLRSGEERWLAKRMLRDRIPAMVLNETRKGVQAADWHLRIGRTRAALRAEIERIESDPAMARRFDSAGMKAALDDWPADTPLKGARLERLRLAIPRGLLTARFIRYVEGRNDG
jgi:asparagine synthase (glutamine-hydrolysing)